MDAAFDRLKLRVLLARLDEIPFRHEFMKVIHAEMSELYPNTFSSHSEYDVRGYFVNCVMGVYNNSNIIDRYGGRYCLKADMFERGATPDVVAAYVARLEPLLARLEAIDTRALMRAITPSSNTKCTR